MEAYEGVYCLQVLERNKSTEVTATRYMDLATIKSSEVKVPMVRSVILQGKKFAEAIVGQYLTLREPCR